MIKRILRRIFGRPQFKNVHNSISKDLHLDNEDMLSVNEYVYIGPKCRFMGNGRVKIGNNVIIGPSLSVFTTGHDYRSDMIPYDPKKDKTTTVTINDNVWIGGNVTILPGVRIGEGAVIGAGSVVTKDVINCSIVAGNPAKVINMRSIDEYKKMIKSGELYLVKKMKDKC